VLVLLLAALTASSPALADDYEPINTQAVHEHPLPPSEAVRHIQVPNGFQVTLSAAEPDVRQPVAIDFDDRGRLWVAEIYSYAGSDFNDEKHDRILIFEDIDGDGVFDSRKVFADGLNRLLGLVVGSHGVWVATAPTVAFIADTDGDERADGPPIVHLDGFSLKAEHNTLNGLTWGPDGWLYGRHGIKSPSHVGVPGTPDSQRVELSCAIWRYHPVRHTFEVVADGTINPWGLDFNDTGDAFISTSVIDHYWHIVPGARLERWNDRPPPDPQVYELMSSTNDHLHWAGGGWNEAGRESADNDALGGGHSHCDAMIYLGDRWPDEYRGSVLMSNIHGRRLNRDVIHRQNGDGRYLASHAPDFLRVDDPWFRAVAMKYGPDGDMFMTDWSDNGECHDRDGIHRTSGRIYKISYGAPRHVEVDLGALDNLALVELQLHANDWFVRHARRLLQDRTTAGEDMSPARDALHRMFNVQTDVTRRLRALWALYACDDADANWLTRLLDDPDEHMRSWAVRLLTDHGAPSAAAQQKFSAMAKAEPSWLVRMHLAAAVRKLPAAQRWPILHCLAHNAWSEQDQNITRMLWYAIEESSLESPDQAVQLATHAASPRMRTFVARRLIGAMDDHPEAALAVLDAMAQTNDPEDLLSWLDGLNAALRESRPRHVPPVAAAMLRQWVEHPDPQVRRASLTAGAILGDQPTIDAVAALLHRDDVNVATKQAVLDGLAIRRPDRLSNDLQLLIGPTPLSAAALQIAGQLADPALAQVILTRYDTLPEPEQSLAINALVARPESAALLLTTIAEGRIPARTLSAEQARQIAALGDDALTTQLESLWGSLHTSSEENRKLISAWRARLTPAELGRADLSNGREMFLHTCASCHTLYGNGGKLGPDLTGSGRHEVEYLLENLLDPGAVVPADFRLTIVTLTDGRVLSGMITGRTADTLTIQSSADQTVVETAQIVSTQTLNTSLMPEGLVHTMSTDDFRDLLLYLMSDIE